MMDNALTVDPTPLATPVPATGEGTGTLNSSQSGATGFARALSSPQANALNGGATVVLKGLTDDGKLSQDELFAGLWTTISGPITNPVIDTAVTKARQWLPVGGTEVGVTAGIGAITAGLVGFDMAESYGDGEVTAGQATATTSVVSTSVAASALGGMLTRAAATAAVGSVFPGIGTAAGFAIGLGASLIGNVAVDYLLTDKEWAGLGDQSLSEWATAGLARVIDDNYTASKLASGIWEEASTIQGAIGRITKGVEGGLRRGGAIAAEGLAGAAASLQGGAERLASSVDALLDHLAPCQGGLFDRLGDTMAATIAHGGGVIASRFSGAATVAESASSVLADFCDWVF